MRNVLKESNQKLEGWARSQSLWFFLMPASCCADEVTQTMSCRYDLERFGSKQVDTPEEADLLIVQGSINEKMAAALKEIYSAMPGPKYVMAVGSCACGDVDQHIPVDIYVPGCPPRPEAIMSGIIKLQEKIKKTEGRGLNA